MKYSSKYYTEMRGVRLSKSDNDTLHVVHMTKLLVGHSSKQRFDKLVKHGFKKTMLLTKS